MARAKNCALYPASQERSEKIGGKQKHERLQIQIRHIIDRFGGRANHISYECVARPIKSSSHRMRSIQ
jgi:hypothetical protein